MLYMIDSRLSDLSSLLEKLGGDAETPEGTPPDVADTSAAQQSTAADITVETLQSTILKLERDNKDLNRKLQGELLGAHVWKLIAVLIQIILLQPLLISMSATLHYDEDSLLALTSFW